MPEERRKVPVMGKYKWLRVKGTEDEEICLSCRERVWVEKRPGKPQNGVCVNCKAKGTFIAVGDPCSLCANGTVVGDDGMRAMF